MILGVVFSRRRIARGDYYIDVILHVVAVYMYIEIGYWSYLVLLKFPLFSLPTEAYFTIIHSSIPLIMIIFFSMLLIIFFQLDGYDRVVVGGSAHTVGPGGYTLGGGHSPISRSHGYSVDNVLEMQVCVMTRLCFNTFG